MQKGRNSKNQILQMKKPIHGSLLGDFLKLLLVGWLTHFQGPSWNQHQISRSPTHTHLQSAPKDQKLSGFMPFLIILDKSAKKKNNNK